MIIIIAAIYLRSNVLGDEQLFSEIVLLVHDVGQALMRYIEQINEGLNVPRLEQVCTDTLSATVLVLHYHDVIIL